MTRKPRSLAGRTALVTGAAVRLGRAVALALAERGARVVVHYNTSRGPAARLVAELKARGLSAWAVRGDLAEPARAQEVFARARRVAGPIDILINNASIFPSDTLADVTPESIVRNVRVNAIAPLLLSREFAGQGIGGDIVNYLDARYVDYDDKHVAYHLSKRMLFTLTRMMALQYAPRVKVNAVAPGLILPPAGQDESYLANLAHSNPLQGYGGPEDVVEATLFLLRSDFVTGQIIFVDGGRHLKGSMYGS